MKERFKEAVDDMTARAQREVESDMMATRGYIPMETGIGTVYISNRAIQESNVIIMRGDGTITGSRPEIVIAFLMGKGESQAFTEEARNRVRGVMKLGRISHWSDGVAVEEWVEEGGQKVPVKQEQEQTPRAKGEIRSTDQRQEIEAKGSRIEAKRSQGT